MSMKNSMTPTVIEAATIRFVAQNHCATAVPWLMLFRDIISVDCDRRKNDRSTPCGKMENFLLTLNNLL